MPAQLPSSITSSFDLEGRLGTGAVAQVLRLRQRKTGMKAGPWKMGSGARMKNASGDLFWVWFYTLPMKNSMVYLYSYWMVWWCSTEIVLIQNSCNIGVPNLLYPLLPVGPESYWEAPAENSRDATSGWAVGRAKDPGVKILMNWSFQERSCRWANKKKLMHI